MLQGRSIEDQLTIWDYSNILLGGFDNVVLGLMVNNPDFESIDVDLDDFVGKTIAWDDSYYKSQTVQLQLSNTSTSEPYNYGTGLDGQTLYDLILMNRGSLDNIVQTLVLNNWDNINNHIVTGTLFKFDKLKSNDSLTTVINKKSYVFGSGGAEFELSYLLRVDGRYLLKADGSKIVKNG